MLENPAVTGRRIALIAHDNKKQDMLEWADYNLALLTGHELFATATTGRLLREQLGLPVTSFAAGRSAVTCRSAPASPKAGSICSSSCGIRWNRTRTTRTSRPFSGSRWSAISRSPATGPPRTS